MKSTKKHCVITGAASGIGRALAERFGQAGYRITGLDLAAEQAAQTQADLRQRGLEIEFILADLGRQADLQTALAELNRKPKIDVFIHNAGLNAVGRFDRLPLARQQTVVQVNLLAPLLLTAGLLRDERLTRPASLVFISSLSHFVSYPGAAVYAASKDGLAAYARSLSVALAGQQIHVLRVYPGPTRTAHARRYSPDNSREASRMPPEQLAAEIFKAVQARRTVLIPGLVNKFFALLGRYLPGVAEFTMRKTILDKLPPT